jgi:hypothetical protein
MTSNTSAARAGRFSLDVHGSWPEEQPKFGEQTGAWIDAEAIAEPKRRHGPLSDEPHVHGGAARMCRKGFLQFGEHAARAVRRRNLDDDGIGFPDEAVPPWSIVSRVAECGGRLTLGKNGQQGGHLLITLPEA